LAQLPPFIWGPSTNRLLALAVVVALGTGGAQAKTAYCQDPTTHKRISCKSVDGDSLAVKPVPMATRADGRHPGQEALDVLRHHEAEARADPGRTDADTGTRRPNGPDNRLHGERPSSELREGYPIGGAANR